MGIGMTIICSKINVDKITRAVPGSKVIGQVISQPPGARVVIK
jgi:hypothetical protein